MPTSRAKNGVRVSPEGFVRRGLDLDALRMYLRWRGCTLVDLREGPATYRDPESLPADPNPPGDGAIEPEDTPDPAADAVTDGGADESVETGNGAETETDPWGAEAFLDDIEGDAYGTTPEKLRDGLEVLVAESVVWVSPGLPFIVPMFLGLVMSLVYGDLLVSAVSLLT